MWWHWGGIYIYIYTHTQKKVKCSRYRPGVAQRVGTGIALLFHDRSTRRGWVASSTLRPHFSPGKDPVPILQEAGWAPGPVWRGGKSRPHRDSIPDLKRKSRYRPTEWLFRDFPQQLEARLFRTTVTLTLVFYFSFSLPNRYVPVIVPSDILHRLKNWHGRTIKQTNKNDINKEFIILRL